MSQIQTLVLDVDGVIVGEKNGYNSPYPHPDVMKKMKEIRKKGIDVINLYLKENIYLEVYSLDDYYIAKSQLSDITSAHSQILDKEPIIVDSLIDKIAKIEITKIMPIAKDEKEEDKAQKLFNNLGIDLSIYWGIHPIALPLQFGNITAKGFTKKRGVKDILSYLHLDFKNTLGVGDSLDDWQFIELCGFGATLANGKEELKKLISSKEKYYIGPSVDQNGILDILSYFKL